MTIANAVDAYLRTDTTLMAYLGTNVAPSATAGRLYYLQAIEGATLPYVVYSVVSDLDEAAHFNKTNTGWGRVQFDVVAKTKGGQAIEERIRTLMRYKTGSTGGLTVYVIKPLNRRERFEYDTQRYIFSADYEVECEY
jgi:hypothetical protein